MLYLFACISPQCVKLSDSVKVFRCVVHDRNPFVTYASDDDYNYVLNRGDKNLRTSKFAALYDAGVNEPGDASSDEDSDDARGQRDNEAMIDTVGEDETKEDESEAAETSAAQES